MYYETASIGAPSTSYSKKLYQDIIDMFPKVEPSYMLPHDRRWQYVTRVCLANSFHGLLEAATEVLRDLQLKALKGITDYEFTESDGHILEINVGYIK